MSYLKETAVLTELNLESLGQRLPSMLVMIVGIAVAVATMLSLLSLGAGARNAALNNIVPGRVIVLTRGAASENRGDLSPSAAAAILDAPGIKRGAGGEPMAQPMPVVLVDVVRKDNGVGDSIFLRGTGAQGLAMDPAFRLTAGRMYRPGADELIAGKAAEREFSGLGLGAQIPINGAAWAVVGTYADGGGLAENELMTDSNALLAASSRHTYQSVAAILDGDHAFERFKDALTSDPRLFVTVLPYREFVEEQTAGVTRVLDFVAYVIGGIMCVGATFGAANAMYSVVDARTEEISVLRAIGFRGAAILASVLAEASLLSVPGALIGAAFAWVLFNNHEILWSGRAFQIALTPQLAAIGIGAALAIGLAGALAPAIRASLTPVALGLRAT